MHPRCRHGVSTYYEGINDEPEEVTNAKHNHDKEDKYTQYLQQRQKQYERLAVGSLLPENVSNYQNKANELKCKINSNFIDITEQYTIEKDYNIIEEQCFIDKDNHKYKADGKNVIMKPTAREKEVANILGRIYGGQVKIIPRINEPSGIKTPDYKINNEKFDLKQIIGTGKYVIEGNIKGKKEQANNFIIDITESEINIEEAIRQIQSIYNSKRYQWVNKIFLLKGDKFLKIYKRK